MSGAVLRTCAEHGPLTTWDCPKCKVMSLRSLTRWKVTARDMGEPFTVKVWACDRDHAVEKFWDALIQDDDMGIEVDEARQVRPVERKPLPEWAARVLGVDG